jgi:hypothetical protein
VTSEGEWRKVRTLVLLLLLLQLVVVVFAWLLNPTAQKSQTAYAFLLAADLVAFSMVSYMSRAFNRGDSVNGGYVLAGCAVALGFMVLVLLV